MAKDSLDYRRNRESLFAEFPNMPEHSALEILKHGFLKGSGRVGRAKVLDEDLRMILATNAYIRHKLTAYESILDETASSEQRQDAKRIAREKIHDQVQEIADRWRSKNHSNPQHNTGRSKIKQAPTAMTSRLTLEKNRSRRGGQMKLRRSPRHLRGDRDVKAAKEVLKLLGLNELIGQMGTVPTNNEEEALTQAVQSLDLKEYPIAPLVRKKRVNAKIRGDLERLKRNPSIRMSASRLAHAIEMHCSDGGQIAALGLDFPAQLDALTRKNKIAARRARRGTKRNRTNEGQSYHQTLTESEKPHQRQIDSYMLAPTQMSKRLLQSKDIFRQPNVKESHEALAITQEDHALYQKSNLKMRLEEEVRQLRAEENENGLIVPGEDDDLTSGEHDTFDVTNSNLRQYETNLLGSVPMPTMLAQGEYGLESHRSLVIRQRAPNRAEVHQLTGKALEKGSEWTEIA